MNRRKFITGVIGTGVFLNLKFTKLVFSEDRTAKLFKEGCLVFVGYQPNTNRLNLIESLVKRTAIDENSRIICFCSEKADEIKEKVEEFKKDRIGFLLLDYLLPKNSGEKVINKSYELTQTAMILKKLAKELNITVYMLAQISEHTFKNPNITDLQQCNDIKNIADVIMFAS